MTESAVPAAMDAGVDPDLAFDRIEETRPRHRTLSLCAGAVSVEALLSDASHIEVERLDRPSADWDEFALKCDASHRALRGWMAIWQLKYHKVFRTRCYSIFLRRGNDRVKIGQCAIGRGRHKRLFSDGIQLLPEHRTTWTECLQAMLRMSGPGRYVYGSDWSLEPPKEKDIAALPGVTVEAVERFMVEAVDFGRWKSWDDYERSVSANVRRNLKRAAHLYPDVEVETRSGLRALLLTPHLLLSKTVMQQRKLIPSNIIETAFNHILRSIFMRKYAFCAVARAKGRVLAGFGGAASGRQAYYFDGGASDATGAGWLLKMTLMRDFQSRQPTGRFFMGSAQREEDLSDGEWTSPFRYRQDCRVTAFPTSVVTFTYT
jgi:Acetyltransferase (GNAT) domain